MKKNIISTISKNYAKALLESTRGNFEIVKNQLKEVTDIINSSSELNIVMKNSSISKTKKIEILESIFSNKIEEKLLNLLKVLIEKNRFNELESINEAYASMVENISNKKIVEITAPIKLNFENKTNILFKLEHKLNCEVTPIWKIEEKLIAGLVFKIDDCVIDTSVRTKLENLNKKINR